MGSISMCSTGVPPGTAGAFMPLPAQAPSARARARGLRRARRCMLSIDYDNETGAWFHRRKDSHLEPARKVGQGRTVYVRELISSERIARRVAELAREIDARLPPGPLT